MEINGIAHVFVTANDFDRSRAFYEKLLPFLGLKPVLDGGAFCCPAALTSSAANIRAVPWVSIRCREFRATSMQHAIASMFGIRSPPR